MADYKETTVSGTAWQRAQMIIINSSLEASFTAQKINTNYTRR